MKTGEIISGAVLMTFNWQQKVNEALIRVITNRNGSFLRPSQNE
jgi:hypothetical protein